MSMLDGTPLIESQKADNAKPFSDMAHLIKHNEPELFGGAFVVVPPGGREVLTTLLLDSREDPAQFWTTLKTKCDIALAQLIESDRARQSGRW